MDHGLLSGARSCLATGGAGGRWIGFSGGVKLTDMLPAGSSVEGLRLIWYDDDGRPPGLTFNGVGVEFSVPEVLRFKGYVAYSGSKSIICFRTARSRSWSALMAASP
jgi:hypothetical protein